MELLTFPDVAHALKRSVRGVRKDVASGRFGPDIVRLGRSVRVRAVDLAQWIELGCPNRDKWLALRSNTKRASA